MCEFRFEWTANLFTFVKRKLLLFVTRNLQPKNALTIVLLYCAAAALLCAVR